MSPLLDFYYCLVTDSENARFSTRRFRIVCSAHAFCAAVLWAMEWTRFAQKVCSSARHPSVNWQPLQSFVDIFKWRGWCSVLYLCNSPSSPLFSSTTLLKGSVSCHRNLFKILIRLVCQTTVIFIKLWKNSLLSPLFWWELKFECETSATYAPMMAAS